MKLKRDPVSAGSLLLFLEPGRGLGRPSSTARSTSELFELSKILRVGHLFGLAPVLRLCGFPSALVLLYGMGASGCATVECWV